MDQIQLTLQSNTPPKIQQWIDALHNAVIEFDEDCAYAASKLVEVGDDAVPSLRATLFDPKKQWSASDVQWENEDQLENIIEVLAQIASHAAVAVLADVVTLPIEGIGEEVEEGEIWEGNSDQLRRVTWEAFSQIGNAAIPFLLQFLQQDNSDIIEESVYILGDIGDPDAVVPLLDLLRRLQPEAYQKYGNILQLNTVALNALVSLGEVAVNPVEKAFVEVQDAKFRCDLLRILGEIDSPNSMTALRRCAQNSPAYAPVVRLELCWMGEADAVSFQMEELEALADVSPTLPRLVAESVVDRGNRMTDPRIRRFPKGRFMLMDRASREQLYQISLINNAHRFNFLMRAWLRSPIEKDWYQSDLARSTVEIFYHLPVSMYLENVDHEIAAIRRNVAKGLLHAWTYHRMTAEEAVVAAGLLGRRVDAEKDEEVRNFVQIALSKLSTGNYIENLRNEDWGVRRHAIEGLRKTIDFKNITLEEAAPIFDALREMSQTREDEGDQKRAVLLLREFLFHGKPELQQVAAGELADLISPAALTALADVLATPEAGYAANKRSDAFYATYRSASDNSAASMAAMTTLTDVIKANKDKTAMGFAWKGLSQVGRSAISYFVPFLRHEDYYVVEQTVKALSEIIDVWRPPLYVARTE